MRVHLHCCCGWCMSPHPSSLCRTPVRFRRCRFMPKFERGALCPFYKKKKRRGRGDRHTEESKGSSLKVFWLRKRDDGASDVAAAADVVVDVVCRRPGNVLERW